MEMISNFEDLLHIKKNSQYELTEDIDGEGRIIPCIINYFKGSIDGRGHTIKNFVIANDVWGDEQTIALFTSMSRAIIKDVRFEQITLQYDRGAYKPRIGALVGSCTDCSISNVIMSVINSSDNETPMIYEASNCDIQNNKMYCNGKDNSVVKYD